MVPENLEARTQRPRRVDESMTLINEMMNRPLDPGYQAAADRRQAAGKTPSNHRSWVVVAAAVLIGFLFAVGANAATGRALGGAAVRNELVSRIEARQSAITEREPQVESAAKQVRDLQALELSQAGADDVTGRLATLEAAAGTVPMRGSGVTLTLDDAPSSDDAAQAGSRPDGEGFGTGRVSWTDLQIVVNGLWGAGAEAIAINGHRITSQAAIRFAGQAIIVNFRPLTRPYTITVLGNPRQVQAQFESSFAGVYLQQLGSQFAIRASWSPAGELQVPGESAARTDHTTVLRAPSDTPTTTTP